MPRFVNTFLLICLIQGFLLYGPDMLQEDLDKRTKLLGELLSGEKDSICVTKFMEKAKFLKLLINETYQSMKNVPTLLQTFVAQIWKKAGMREESADLHLPHEPVEGTVTETMIKAIKESQEKLEKSVGKDYKDIVFKKMNKIVFDSFRSEGLCTIKLGIHPSRVIQNIADIANLTKMPQKLHDIFKSAVYVSGAGVERAESVAIAANGSVHYILIYVNRKGNDSFDSGLAVFSVHYAIAPEPFQENKDEVNEFIKFASTVDDEGRLTFKGIEDMGAYFHGKAVDMYLEKCPAILKGFKQVTKEIGSS